MVKQPERVAEQEQDPPKMFHCWNQYEKMELTSTRWADDRYKWSDMGPP